MTPNVLVWLASGIMVLFSMDTSLCRGSGMSPLKSVAVHLTLLRVCSATASVKGSWACWSADVLYTLTKVCANEIDLRGIISGCLVVGDFTF